jgi:hypothetical protein
MSTRSWLAWLLPAVLLLPLLCSPAPGCCPAPPAGKPVVNADQTVIIIWDAATKTQHFIRQASFQSEADDFGFLVPTPAEPVLEESGNEAFPFLAKVTAPATSKVHRPSSGISCSAPVTQTSQVGVKVLQEKEVAGFHAVVLETNSPDALVAWLKEHGYAFSAEVEAWAKPYVEQGWKITALKVAKNKDDKEKKTVVASALRVSFKTDRPLFPYREPDPESAAKTLNAKHRLLRIFFLAEARYQGELSKETPWTGIPTWSDKLTSGDRKKLLEMLKLQENAAPAECWLTEFEDNWPYRAAPADVYFSRAADQSPIKRQPIIQYVPVPSLGDVTVCAIAAVLFLPPLARRLRRGTK